ncbi:HipA-like protein [Pannus brasiliensis CCIBt3594]|uniref:HipA-like protein n=1 Tax=Pannus brasiliensis CCIBt3594 TaxID=1427578 RepID=A0AAW9QUQ1_9CHRO
MTIFPIIEVPPDAAAGTEPMGTKEKFWLDDSLSGRKYLCKKARSNRGEDWAEKIAAELCGLLKLPSASYDLAVYRGERQVISPSFVPEAGALIAGNEILARIIENYPQDSQNPKQHTLDNVFRAIEEEISELPPNWASPDERIGKPADVFVGYLLLDAWIGNTDRHHENWACIRWQGRVYLAPTYDHGSCLGRELEDKVRAERLQTKDRNRTVRVYVEKCQSCLYDRIEDKKPLKTFDAFTLAARKYPSAARAWLRLLGEISAENTLTLLERVPKERITPIAIEFAQAILKINRDRLLAFGETL